jgi:serine/threonine kinase 16
VGEKDVSERVKEVMRMCLKVEPAERPSIAELIEEVGGVIEDLEEDE